MVARGKGAKAQHYKQWALQLQRHRGQAAWAHPWVGSEVRARPPECPACGAGGRQEGRCSMQGGVSEQRERGGSGYWDTEQDVGTGGGHPHHRWARGRTGCATLAVLRWDCW